MENSQDAINAKNSVERLKVVAATRGTNPITRVEGNYEFENLKTEGPVSCHWRFQSELVGLTVRGQVNGVMKLECARCLEPYEVPVNLEVHERYVFESSLTRQDKERELQSDDFYEVVDEEGELDLKDLAFQFLTLESLSHPYCERPECGFA
ncbi:DUF177 domain-containing protein [Vampirovibrio sp.]|uniref:YceD family protein n=1 Tax=Vampirovibrio sp. TaxID=2717857 RepID=UPI003593ADE8